MHPNARHRTECVGEIMMPGHTQQRMHVLITLEMRTRVGFTKIKTNGANKKTP